MLSTSTSSNGMPVTESSKQDFHENMLISTSAAIVPSTLRGQHQCDKQNKLSCTLPDSLISGTSDMSTSTTRSLFTHPSSLKTCIKSPPIIAAVHHHQSQHLYEIQKQSSRDSFQSDKELRQHTSLSVNLPLETPSSLCCTAIKVNANPLILQKMTRTLPSDKINLRLILVSGKTEEFLFNPSDSAGDIAQTVFENWPTDWSQEAVSKAEILRLIYQGRFLHCNVTLGALGLPLGKTTVMHLVPRDNLPEPNSQDQIQKSKSGSGRCCSTTCCIL
ncbi:hypothetical protein ACLKA7_001511 [Drosophila subpalustris]